MFFTVVISHKLLSDLFIHVILPVKLMVIVEYCRYGNLHDYLLRHRDDFVDQLDCTTGKLNLALGNEKVSRSQSTTKNTK